MGPGLFARCFGATKTVGEAERNSNIATTQSEIPAVGLQMVRSSVCCHLIDWSWAEMLNTQGDVVKWTPEDVQRWLSTVGSGEHAHNFEGMTGQVSFCWGTWQAECSSVQMSHLHWPRSEWPTHIGQQSCLQVQIWCVAHSQHCIPNEQLQDLLELTDAEIMARVTARKPAAKLAKAVQHLQRTWLQVTQSAVMHPATSFGSKMSYLSRNLAAKPKTPNILLPSSNTACMSLHFAASGHAIWTTASIVFH